MEQLKVATNVLCAGKESNVWETIVYWIKHWKWWCGTSSRIFPFLVAAISSAGTFHPFENKNNSSVRFGIIYISTANFRGIPCSLPHQGPNVRTGLRCPKFFKAKRQENLVLFRNIPLGHKTDKTCAFRIQTTHDFDNSRAALLSMDFSSCGLPAKLLRSCLIPCKSFLISSFSAWNRCI